MSFRCGNSISKNGCPPYSLHFHFFSNPVHLSSKVYLNTENGGLRVFQDHIVVQLEIALQSRCLIASLSLKTVVPWRKGEALLSYVIFYR